MYIEIDQKKIYYEFVNKQFLETCNSIIIFIHEGLGCTEQWFDFPSKVTTSLQIAGFVYDRFGFGKSDLKEKNSPDYLQVEANFLNKLINNLLPNQKVILLGHSDGATISLMYGSMYHNNLQAIISIAHHVVIEDVTIAGMRKAIDAYENGKLRDSLQKFHGNKTDSMFYNWADFSIYDANFNMSEDLQKIQVPVLAIQGDKDQYGSKLQLDLIQKNVKNAETLMIENCNHYPHRKFPDLVIENLKKFINKNKGC